MTTRPITLATTVGYFKWLPCWHSMGKSNRITVFNMLSPTNCKKDILPKYNSWPQSKMMMLPNFPNLGLYVRLKGKCREKEKESKYTRVQKQFDKYL